MTGPTAPASAGRTAGPTRVLPFQEFVLKVHSRCNLACDYCYVYRHADQSWRSRPRTMSRTTVRTVATRIAEHCRSHRLRRTRVTFHGGEPLLAGAEALAAAARVIREAVPDATEVRYAVQTNGVLLDAAALRVLDRAGIGVGISLDGPADRHDAHRRRPDGGGSYAGVARAIRLLAQERHRHLFDGLLCTVSLDTDPVACYESLVGFDPPRVDFLLPHATWAAPPPPPPDGPAPHPYGSWLAAVFDRWYSAPRQETEVGLLGDVVNLLLGGASRSEQVGLSPVAVVVVETDGAIEQVDALKTAYAGAPATGLHVRSHPFDAALAHPGLVERQAGLAALADTCRRCPLVAVCGGGHYAHRYRPGAGFRNPSVYCPDLAHLIRHVRRRLSADLAGRRR